MSNQHLPPAFLGTGSEGVFTDESADRVPINGLPPALPCPFCGRHEDIFLSQRELIPPGGEAYTEHQACCGNCGAGAPAGRSRLDAANGWNTRAGVGGAD